MTSTSSRDLSQLSLRQASSADREKVAALLKLKWSPFIPVTPTAKQHVFLWTPDREVLYGGAAGGGKSEAGLAGAAQYVDHPHYAGLLIRRTYQDLAKPGALMDRSHRWWSRVAGFDKGTMTWEFPSGAKVAFGYIRNDTDLDQYQSAEFQYIFFDELTQFTLHQYRFMLSRLRRKAGMGGVPLRMRAGSNPGGRGHEWVKERWRLGSKYRETGLGPPEGRRFIPAKLGENPHLDRESYMEMLAELDPILRKQLLEGDWDAAYQGTKFKRQWFSLLEDSPPLRSEVSDKYLGPVITRRLRYWDRAATEPAPGKDPDWTVGVLMGVTDLEEFVILDVVRFRGTPAENERTIKLTAERDGRDVPVVMEQEPGSSGVDVIDHYRRRVLAGWTFRGNKVTGSKELRANPLSSQAEGGGVKLVRADWNEAWLDELVGFPEGEHDDQVDATSGCFQELTLNVYEGNLAV